MSKYRARHTICSVLFAMGGGVLADIASGCSGDPTPPGFAQAPSPPGEVAPAAASASLSAAVPPVDPRVAHEAMLKRLASSELSGLVLVPLNRTLYPSAAAARASTLPAREVVASGCFPSVAIFRVLADNGDVVEVTGPMDRKSAPTACMDGVIGEWLERSRERYRTAFVRRQDLVLLTTGEVAIDFSDETALRLSAGVALQLEVDHVTLFGRAFVGSKVAIPSDLVGLSYPSMGARGDFRPLDGERPLRCTEQQPLNPGNVDELNPLIERDVACYLDHEAPMALAGAPLSSGFLELAATRTRDREGVELVTVGNDCVALRIRSRTRGMGSGTGRGCGLDTSPYRTKRDANSYWLDGTEAGGVAGGTPLAEPRTEAAGRWCFQLKATAGPVCFDKADVE